jgi:transposase
MVKGVKSQDVWTILNQIPLDKRNQVKEISLDMANNMEKIASLSFPKASIVTDRFHVAKLISEAVQEIRIKFRWIAIDEQNRLIKEAKSKGEKYVAHVFENGDTRKQLLARSRYLLFKPQSKWHKSQRIRAEILFEQYPDIEKAYKLSMAFRNIYETAKSPTTAEEMFENWTLKVRKYDFEAFATVADSINSHKETILNFFNNRTTNALAESFNSKIKAFRSVFRGVKDLKFFIFRLAIIMA